MNNIFVLSYCNASNFIKSTSNLFNYNMIDNGNQEYNTTPGCHYFSTDKNIGCAGGWNLICDIAFDSLGLDKILITQDDASVPLELMLQALAETDGLSITGVIQPFFEFSCFAITKQVWNKIGRFDENFIYVYCEDADYKQRCYLDRVTINSLYTANKDMNQSLTLKEHPNLDRIVYNREYLYTKWGESIHPSSAARADGQAPFSNRTPFAELSENLPINYIPRTNRISKIYGDSDKFPSEIEYERFKEKQWNLK
jgi:hypothetical protein